MAAPNAVTAMPLNAFAGGRPVSQVGMTVPRTEIVRIQAAQVMVAPGVAPMRQALAPMVSSRPVTRPPASVISRAVVVKAPLPLPTIPFAAKQATLERNAGRPLDMQAVRQAAPPARPAVDSPARPPANPAFRPAVASAQPAPRPPTAESHQNPPQKAKPDKVKEKEKSKRES